MMRSTQHTLKSSDKRKDDLISVTDIEESFDKPIISSNTYYNDTYKNPDVWVIHKLIPKDVFVRRSKWNFRAEGIEDVHEQLVKSIERRWNSSFES